MQKKNIINQVAFIAYNLIILSIVFVSTEAVLHFLKIPKEKYSIIHFSFPPQDMFGKAFLPDKKLFWKLAPGYNGRWTMWKLKYNNEHTIQSINENQRKKNYPEKQYYEKITWQINDLGFRGQRHNPNSKIILCIGSSVTMGWGIDEKNCFAGLLRQRLKPEHDIEWDVINAGVPGYSSFQTVRYLEEICRKIKPRIIIFESGINDGILSLGHSDEEKSIITNGTWVNRHLARSNLLLFLYFIFHDRAASIRNNDIANSGNFYASSMYIQGKSRVSENSFQKNLMHAQIIAKSVNAKLFFIFPPLYNEYGQKEILKSVNVTYSNEINICSAISCLQADDLSSFFLPYDEAHFSRKGHKFIADLIWNTIADDLTSDQRDNR